MEKKEKTIYEKLLGIQQELKAPKGQYNAFGKYNYRSCEDILEALKPLLKKNDCLMTLNDELVQIGERYYVKATATIFDATDKIVNTSYAREEETKKGMDGSQITGASSSYARKYALNGLLLIDDVKDSDSTNNEAEEVKMTEEEAFKYANELVFPTGKHKDWTLARAIEEDKGFVSWLVNNSTDAKLLKAIELLTGEVKKSENEWDDKLKLTQELQRIIVDKELDVEAITDYYGVKTLKELSDKQIKEIIAKKG